MSRKGGNLKTQALTFRQIQGKGQQLEPQLKDRGQTEHSDGDKQTNKQTNPVQIRHDFDNSDIQFKPGQTRKKKKKSHTGDRCLNTVDSLADEVT